MGDLIKSGGGGLIGLLHSQNGELTMPKPFEREIFLFDTYIAGTSFIEGIEELEKHLPTLIGENPLELTHKLYEESRVTATKKEMENFCNRYVKTLKLKIVEGKFVIEIQK